MTQRELRLLHDLLMTFYTREEAFSWLFTEHPQLRNERPIDTISVGGIADVLSILHRLSTDSYV